MLLANFLKLNGKIIARASASKIQSRRPVSSLGDAWHGLREPEAKMPAHDTDLQPVSGIDLQQASGSYLAKKAVGGLPTKDDGWNRTYCRQRKERMCTRLLEAGQKAMPDCELLELLLFNAIPRTAVKLLAKRLLAEFGDLNGVILASKHRILKVDGANETVFYHLRLAEAFAHRMSHAKLRNRDVLSSWDALLNYCRTVMAHAEIEQFRVFFLDRKNVLIADEEQGKGTVDHVPVYPREVVKRALELNASAIVVVHNHPSGDPTPSRQDVDMTYQISAACEAIGVTIHDHLVIGKAAEFSFRQNGYL